MYFEINCSISEDDNILDSAFLTQSCAGRHLLYFSVTCAFTECWPEGFGATLSYWGSTDLRLQAFLQRTPTMVLDLSMRPFFLVIIVELPSNSQLQCSAPNVYSHSDLTSALAGSDTPGGFELWPDDVTPLFESDTCCTMAVSAPGCAWLWWSVLVDLTMDVLVWLFDKSCVLTVCPGIGWPICWPWLTVWLGTDGSTPGGKYWPSCCCCCIWAAWSWSHSCCSIAACSSLA